MKCFVILFFVLVSVDFSWTGSSYDTELAKTGVYSYHVAIRKWAKGSSAHTFLCSGALISANHVITSAHCVYRYDASILLVLLGNIVRFKGTEKKVLKKTIHPKFDWKTNSGYDIALLEIESVMSSKYIHPIDLPAMSDLDRNYETHIVVTTGWELKAGTGKNNLQYACLVALNNNICKNVQPSIAQDVVCAASPFAYNSCGHDTGRPLVEIQSYTLIGIYSLVPGRNCSVVNFGTVYTRIASFRKWIQEQSGV